MKRNKAKSANGKKQTQNDILNKQHLLQKKQEALCAIIQYNAEVINSWLKKSGIPNAELIRASHVCMTVGTRIKLKTRSFDVCLIGIGNKEHMHKELIIKPTLFWTSDIITIDKKTVKDDLESVKLFTFFLEHMSDLEQELIKSAKAKKLFKTWYSAFQGLHYGS